MHRKKRIIISRDIYIAAGCFWGTAAYFKRVPGVLKVEEGYANGKTENTSYEELDQSGHALTVHITYDATYLSLAEILERFYRIIDLFSVNEQGEDEGSQYRTGIYFTNTQDEKLIRYSIEQLESRISRKTAIEVEQLSNWVIAEDYHHNYLEKNPGGYCHIALEEVSRPLWDKDYSVNTNELKDELDPNIYHIVVEKGTEEAHSHPYLHESRLGIYVDILSGQPLFSSIDRYDSECGWPSFTKGISTDALVYELDDSHNMKRMEVLTRNSRSHLGHVFNDGPSERGGLRYCINGASIRFVPRDDMENEGYQAFLPFIHESISEAD